MKRTTHNREKELKPATISLIRRTHGLAAEIATEAGVDPSFVAKILARTKKPSQKVIQAIPRALLQHARRFDRMAFEAEYPA